jgi:cysteinyl-tRNA synthetase
MAESGSEAMAARAIARKAYKQAKKKRRAEKKKLQKAQQEEGGPGQVENNKQAETLASTKWHRAFEEDGCRKATDRPVDDAKISEMLEKRSEAKAVKNYTVSDEITLQLIDLEIVYDDQMKQWHTRLLSTVGQKAKKEQAYKRASENTAPSEERVSKKAKK